jgi:HD-like signal output (HDOD) protein
MRSTLPVPGVTEDPTELSWFGEVGEPQMDAAASKAAIAAQLVGLKAFPAVAQEVLRRVRHPDVSITSLREVIERDPALASRLVRVASSAALGLGNRCRSIDDAVLRLGTRRVRDVVAGIAAFGLFPADPHARAVRSHCAGVAAITEVLGREWRGRRAPDLFLCGLLHDVGELLIAQEGLLDYGAMEGDSVDTVRFAERVRLGYDHAALGAVAVELWQLPVETSRAIAWHHEPAAAYATDPSTALDVVLLRLADRIEHRLAAGDTEGVDFDEMQFELSYAGFSSEVLTAMWPKLHDARDELVSQLDG